MYFQCTFLYLHQVRLLSLLKCTAFVIIILTCDILQFHISSFGALLKRQGFHIYTYISMYPRVFFTRHCVANKQLYSIRFIYYVLVFVLCHTLAHIQQVCDLSITWPSRQLLIKVPISIKSCRFCLLSHGSFIIEHSSWKF